MDGPTVNLIEKLFYKKIMLYNDLLHYFKEERESLINIDLDKLWKISTKKEEVCPKIESTRQAVISAVNKTNDQKPFNLNRIMEYIPGECREKFQKLYLRIIKLKSEINVIREENMSFMDDSLQFLDEMISIITGEAKSEIVYNDRCHFTKPNSHLFLNREV